MLCEVCGNQLSAEDEGVLDVATTGKAIFSPRDIDELVQKMNTKP